MAFKRSWVRIPSGTPDEPLLHGKRGFFNSLLTEAVKNHTKSNSNHCRKILERTEPLMMIGKRDAKQPEIMAGAVPKAI